MPGADSPPARYVYWCEVHAYSPGTGGAWPLARRLTGSPHLSLRWLRDQAARLAGALDPNPACDPLPMHALRGTGQPSAPAQFFRQWLDDLFRQEEQTHSLASGRTVSIITGGPDRVVGQPEEEVRYCLSARPAMVRSPVTSGSPSAATGGPAFCGAPFPADTRLAGEARHERGEERGQVYDAGARGPYPTPVGGAATVSARWAGLPFAVAAAPVQSRG